MDEWRYRWKGGGRVGDCHIETQTDVGALRVSTPADAVRRASPTLPAAPETGPTGAELHLGRISAAARRPLLSAALRRPPPAVMGSAGAGKTVTAPPATMCMSLTDEELPGLVLREFYDAAAEVPLEEDPGKGAYRVDPRRHPLPAAAACGRGQLDPRARGTLAPNSRVGVRERSCSRRLPPPSPCESPASRRRLVVAPRPRACSSGSCHPCQPVSRPHALRPPAFPRSDRARPTVQPLPLPRRAQYLTRRAARSCCVRRATA